MFDKMDIVMTLQKMQGVYGLYIGFESKTGKTIYNVVPKWEPIPTSGYYCKEYLEKIKSVTFD